MSFCVVSHSGDHLRPFRVVLSSTCVATTSLWRRRTLHDHPPAWHTSSHHNVVCNTWVQLVMIASSNVSVNTTQHNQERHCPSPENLRKKRHRRGHVTRKTMSHWPTRRGVLSKKFITTSLRCRWRRSKTLVHSQDEHDAVECVNGRLQD